MSQKLAFMAASLAATLDNPSLRRTVDGEEAVVLSLADAKIWQKELIKISRVLKPIEKDDNT